MFSFLSPWLLVSPALILSIFFLVLSENQLLVLLIFWFSVSLTCASSFSIYLFLSFELICFSFSSFFHLKLKLLISDLFPFYCIWNYIFDPKTSLCVFHKFWFSVFILIYFMVFFQFFFRLLLWFLLIPFLRFELFDFFYDSRQFSEVKFFSSYIVNMSSH